VLDKIRNPFPPIEAGNVASRIAMLRWLNHDNITLLKREFVGIID
jgi:hypothetical protein